jgi:hypothetical protein
MSDVIENKIANSGLITLDLVDFVKGVRFTEFDLKPFLWQEIALKEKDYREALKEQEWSSFEGQVIGVSCTSDAILPQWAYILPTVYLSEVCKAVYVGNTNEVIEQYVLEQIIKLDVSEYQNERVIVKGCGKPWVSDKLFVAFTQKLQPVVKSLMYGEACSTVPIYKRR